MKVYSILYKTPYNVPTHYIIAAENESLALALAFNDQCGTFLDGTSCKPNLDDYSRPTAIEGLFARKCGIKSKLKSC